MKTTITLKLDRKDKEVNTKEAREIVNVISQWNVIKQQNSRKKIILDNDKSKFHIELCPCRLDHQVCEQSIKQMLSILSYNHYSLEQIEFEEPLIPIISRVESLNIPNSWKADQDVLKIFKKCNLKENTEAKTLLVALRRVSMDGDIEGLRTLLKYTSHHINARDENPAKRKTALHWAVAEGKTDIIRVLLNHGASIEIPDANRLTPFDYACAKYSSGKSEEVELIKLLTPQEYLITYRDFIKLLIMNEDIPLNFINILYHALNKIVVTSPLRNKKISFLLKTGLKIEIEKIARTTRAGVEHDMAIYNDGSNKIYFYHDRFLKFTGDIQRVLSHELEHAYKARIHIIREYKNPNEKFDNAIQASGISLPFFPQLKSQLYKFKSNLAKGDEAILKDFYILLNNEKLGNTLSVDEQGRLSAYKKALRSYKVPFVSYEFTLNYDKNLQDKQIQEKINNKTHKYLLYINVEHVVEVPFYIEKIEVEKNGIVAYGYYANDINDEREKMYAFIYETAMRSNRVGLYAKYAKQAEHHARTIGELPQEIIECFYSSVIKYDQEDENEALQGSAVFTI